MYLGRSRARGSFGSENALFVSFLRFRGHSVDTPEKASGEAAKPVTHCRFAQREKGVKGEKRERGNNLDIDSLVSRLTSFPARLAVREAHTLERIARCGAAFP